MIIKRQNIFFTAKIHVIEDRNSRNHLILMFKISQNDGKKIVQQILKSRCKEKISIFKMMVNLISKKNFFMFLHTFEF